MDLDLTVDSLVLQMTALLDSQSLMDLVLIPYSQHLHLLVILTGSHSSLLDLELYLSLVDLSNLPQQTHQKIQFYLLDLVLQSRDKQTGGLDLDPCLLLVVLQIPSQSTKQQQVYLQYLVLVSRSIPNVISVLQLLLLCLVLQSREQLKIMLEILLSILYLDLLSKEKATPKLDLVPYSLQVEPAESKTSNPPESTVIFVVGGSKAESFTPATEVGSGSLFSVGGLVEAFTVNEAATGLYTISGQVVFNYTVSFVGSGSLFTAGGAAESKTTNKPESTVLFAASGTGAELLQSEKYLSVELYLPSLVKFIERVAVAEEDTTLYTFSGAVEFIYRVRYPGSGTINLLSGAAEASCSCRRIYRTLRVPRKQGRILHTSTLHRIWFLRWILWNESFRETYRSILRNHTTICR